MQLSEIYKELEKKEIYEKIPYSHPKKTKNTVISMSIGRIWFNLLTPDDYILIDEHINKSIMHRIISDIYNKYDPKISSSFVNTLNREAFKLGTIIPSSFDIDALIIPQFIVDKRNELFSKPGITPDEINKIAVDLAKEYLEYVRAEFDSGIYDILMSGAKGSPADWALLMIAKGSPVDIEGNIAKPILHSLDEGMNIEEFYNSAAGARSTLFTKVKGSAEPGYLAAQTAFANSGIILSGDDCNTKRYLKLLITSSIADKIQGRYYLNEKTNTLELINESNAKKLINKTISLRSPLYCIQPDGICKTCYGKLADALGTDKIGLLTAATVNDYGVNGAMKARHLTTQLSAKKANFIKDIITS